MLIGNGKIPEKHCTVIIFVFFAFFAHDTSEAFAFRTCADGGVEREHLVVGLFKRDAVRLELGTETVQACLLYTSRCV